MPDARSALRDTLVGLGPYLCGEFARGRVWYESDLHYATIFYLMRELAARDDRWLVGSQHWIGRSRPDIVCYFRQDNHYETFLRNPGRAVRAVVELKFASGLGRDLNKLRTIQKDRPRVMTWMVYGDHFDPSIHGRWAREHAKREAEILAWEAEAPELRGRTILKCGQLQAEGSLAPYSEMLTALNRCALFWQTRAVPDTK